EGAWINPLHVGVFKDRPKKWGDILPRTDESFHPTVKGYEEGYAVAVNAVLNGAPEGPPRLDTPLHQGERVVNEFKITTSVPRITNLIIRSAWGGSDFIITLTSPSGVVVDRSNDGLEARHATGSDFELLEIPDPEPGVWRISILAA